MEIIWPIILILFLSGCGYSWGYFVARKGRGWGWRISFGIMGAVLWPIIGYSIDRVVYKWLQKTLGGGPDWLGVLGVYGIAALIVVLLGALCSLFVPPLK